MPTHEKKDDSRTIDLEKNQAHSSLTVSIHCRRLLVIITFAQVFAFVVVLQNRGVIDNVHRVLNSVLLGVLSAGLSQCILQFFRPVNYEKMFKSVIWGGINGILITCWIDFLFSNVEQLPRKVLSDQLIAIPIFQVIAITYNCIWEKIDIIHTLKKILPRTLGMSYMVWPVASILSFGVLPQQLIFPFNCIVNFIWTVILGLLT